MNFFLEQNNKASFWAKINLYLKAGEIDAAERAIELEISRRGQTSELLFFMGVVKHCSEDYPAATKYWREALHENPHNTPSFLCLAVMLCDLGDAYSLENLIKDLSHGSFDPMSIGPVAQAEAIKHHLQMAALMEDSGQTEASIQEGMRALAYDPVSYDAHLSMGKIFYKVKDFKKSQDHLEKCDRLAKGRADHLLLLAMINYLAQRHQLATQYLQRVPENHRDYPFATSLLKIL